MITAEGRTHPVTTYFLEDVYETIEYCLPSDSPASINYGSFSSQKVYLLMVFSFEDHLFCYTEPIFSRFSVSFYSLGCMICFLLVVSLNCKYYLFDSSVTIFVEQGSFL